MSNVVPFPNAAPPPAQGIALEESATVRFMPLTTDMPIPVPRVLHRAAKDLDEAVVVGTDKDGDLYVSCNHNDVGRVVMLLEQAKRYLLDWEFGRE